MVAQNMPTGQDIDRTARPISGFVRGARWVYVASVVVFMAGVIVQVFLAGAGALVTPAYWSSHELVGHLMGQSAITILVVGLFGRLPWRVHGLNFLVFVLYAMQYVFLWLLPDAVGVPALRALHAVNALAMFWLASYLIRQGRTLARQRVLVQAA